MRSSSPAPARSRWCCGNTARWRSAPSRWCCRSRSSSPTCRARSRCRSEIFEDIGVVQEGMITIAQPLRLIDAPDARPLDVREGRIAFEDVRFGYGRETGVLEGFTLAVRPGEKIGLV